MNIAIFYDAEAVAGDASLLRAAKQELIDAMRGERVHLARFARGVDAFPTPIGFFNNLVTSRADGDALDLKKGGIFPIVHGVRALALEKGLTETNTAARIARLAELGAFEPEFARELTEALRYLMTMRLDAEIAEKASTSLVKPADSRPWSAIFCATPSGDEEVSRDGATPFQSGDVLMLARDQAARSPIPAARPGVSLPVRRAVRRGSGRDRLRNDRARSA